ncbi:MAG: ROK family protein [Bacteroidetes bacterium]|nr:ROK family protein [Bacteroidota bacterium]MDA1121169.1 ROK family protein [Bacteroidota bacterium]
MVIGIDLGATKIAGGLFDIDGNLTITESILLNNATGNEVGILITGLIDKLLKSGSEQGLTVKGIGVCVPGISNQHLGTVWAPNIPGWESYRLHEEISQMMEDNSVAVVIDSDRSCSLLGEVWKGCAQGSSNAIFLAIGSGIGAGILANGTIVTGAGGIAGAVGWLGLNQPYFTKYDSCGNFEYYASGIGLVRYTRELMADDTAQESILWQKSLENITAEDVFEAYDQGDSIAGQVIENAIVYWGIAVANLTSIFNPEIIIFGGGVFGPATKFLNEIKEEAKKWAQPISIGEVDLQKSSLGGNAGMIGAGYLAIKELSGN